MPKGKSICPVCGGKGVLTEDTRKYEFVTRDPQTSKCLVCNGEGYVSPRTKLSNGVEAHTLFPRAGLNVSKKRALEEAESREQGEESDDPSWVPDIGIPPAKGPSGEDSAEEVGSAVTDVSSAGYWCGCSTSWGKKTPKFMMIMVDQQLGELLDKRQNLVVVSETEPYYQEVYKMVRQYGKRSGSWQEEDEERYVAYLEGLLAAINNKHKENLNA